MNRRRDESTDSHRNREKKGRKHTKETDWWKKNDGSGKKEIDNQPNNSIKKQKEANRKLKWKKQMNVEMSKRGEKEESQEVTI